jgi:hypothetical protein
MSIERSNFKASTVSLVLSSLVLNQNQLYIKRGRPYYMLVLGNSDLSKLRFSIQNPGHINSLVPERKASIPVTFRTRHCTWSWASSLELISFKPISLNCSSILSSHLFPRIQSLSFIVHFSTDILYVFLLSLI